METIIIGKPAVNIYMPLQEFPQEGDIFTIKAKNESLGNVAATAACLLGKWNIPTHFTGVIGNDAYGEMVRDTFKEYRVDTKFLETNFEKGTSLNYYILNAKSGAVTRILYNDPENQLTRFKYDFTPEFAILDGTDFAGAHALLNNNANCKTIFYARTGTKDTIAVSKRCTWVVCTQTFAEMMAKMESDGSAASYVDLYQKIVDSAGNSNYIVILNNHKILYSVDGKVKMLPEMKINIADYSSFDSIFVGALSFALMNEVALDDAIKLANTAAAISISRIGEVPAIPEIDDVLDNSGLREKLGMSRQTTNTMAQAQEVEPLNPNYQVESQTETIASTEIPQDTMVTQAFGSEVSTPENIASPTDYVQEIPQSMQEPAESSLANDGSEVSIAENGAEMQNIMEPVMESGLVDEAANSPETSYETQSPTEPIVESGLTGEVIPPAEPNPGYFDQTESVIENEVSYSEPMPMQEATIESQSIEPTIEESGLVNEETLAPQVEMKNETPAVEEYVAAPENIVSQNYNETSSTPINTGEMTEERINQAFDAVPAESDIAPATDAITENETNI